MSGEGRKVVLEMSGRVVVGRGRPKRVARGTFGEGKGGFPSREERWVAVSDVARSPQWYKSLREKSLLYIL